MDLLRLKPAFKLPSKRPRIPMEPFPAYPSGKSRDEASGKRSLYQGHVVRANSEVGEADTDGVQKEASPQRRCGSRFHSTALLCRLRCFRPRGKRSLHQVHAVRARWSFSFDHFCFSFSLAFFPTVKLVRRTQTSKRRSYPRVSVGTMHP